MSQKAQGLLRFGCSRGISALAPSRSGAYFPDVDIAADDRRTQTHSNVQGRKRMVRTPVIRTRVCRNCKEDKPLNAYYHYHRECKACEISNTISFVINGNDWTFLYRKW